MSTRKTITDFEKEHGGSRIDQLEKALGSAVGIRKPLTVDMPDDGNTITFGVCGDTQFGNVHEATDEYLAYCQWLRNEGVSVKLHTGDVFDGHKVYGGQEFELHALGWDAQKKHFQKIEPKASGLKTYFITGNHDSSLKKLAGLDVGIAIQELRPDWQYIGSDWGDVVLRTKSGREYKVRLLHPDGGTAYAVSYRAQRLAESIDGGNKPNMLCIGHYHKAEHLPTYRNIDILQSGCFEFQTPFMARKGSAAHVGGWLVRVTVGDKKSMANTVRAEFKSFYKRQ